MLYDEGIVSDGSMGFATVTTFATLVNNANLAGQPIQSEAGTWVVSNVHRGPKLVGL